MTPNDVPFEDAAAQLALADRLDALGHPAGPKLRAAAVAWGKAAALRVPDDAPGWTFRAAVDALRQGDTFRFVLFGCCLAYWLPVASGRGPVGRSDDGEEDREANDVLRWVYWRNVGLADGSVQAAHRRLLATDGGATHLTEYLTGALMGQARPGLMLASAAAHAGYLGVTDIHLPANYLRHARALWEATG